MTKEVLYTYLGTNGTVTTTVHLEDIYYVIKYRLTAEKGKRLTQDGINFVNSVVIPEEDLGLWKEVAIGQK
jgi:hypothetical protein